MFDHCKLEVKTCSEHIDCTSSVKFYILLQQICQSACSNEAEKVKDKLLG